MDTKRFTITVKMDVTLTIDAVETTEGASIVDVIDINIPSAGDVMEAIDSGNQFEELDCLFESA